MNRSRKKLIVFFLSSLVLILGFSFLWFFLTGSESYLRKKSICLPISYPNGEVQFLTAHEPQISESPDKLDDIVSFYNENLEIYLGDLYKNGTWLYGEYRDLIIYECSSALASLTVETGCILLKRQGDKVIINLQWNLGYPSASCQGF